MARFQKIDITRKQLFDLLGNPNDKTRPFIIGTIDRKDTATESFTKFVEACLMIHNNNYQNFDAAYQQAIGLKPVNRSGLYDLWWYPKNPKYIYAIDVKDSDFVCRLDINLKKSSL